MKRLKFTDDGNTTVKILSIICPLVYFASYLTRKNYSIVMADIILSEGISNADASLAATLSLISYGVGQIISGVLGDKFKPQRIILCGLSLTALMNIFMPITTDISLRNLIWIVNGFAQSMLWPPLVKIMAKHLDGNTYNRVCVNVNVAGIFATIVLYITASSIWIKYFSWHYVFYSSAIVCILIASLWAIGFKKATKGQEAFQKNIKAQLIKEKHNLDVKQLLLSGFIFIAIAIISQGALRDGITDWVPSFIINTFSLESSSAILKSVLMPVFGVISIKVIGIINQKFVHNEVFGAAVTFGISFVLCLGLAFLYKQNQYITLILAAFISGLMHAINFFLICILPKRFEKYNAVSTLSGVINSLTYLGSAGATYGFGAVSDSFGWNTVVISWCVVALVGGVCCLGAYKKWKKFAID